MLGLQDVKTIGGKYTWVGKRSKYSVMTRIDRVLANCDWLEIYPMATVTLLPWIDSDHSPLLLDTEGSKWKKPRMFRYDARWRLYPDVKQVLEKVLLQEDGKVTVGDIYSIIKAYRKALSKWRSKHNINSEKIISKLKKTFKRLLKLLVLIMSTLLISKLNCSFSTGWKKNIGGRRTEFYGYKQGTEIRNTSMLR